jgi:hypothetical protein
VLFIYRAGGIIMYIFAYNTRKKYKRKKMVIYESHIGEMVALYMGTTVYRVRYLYVIEMVI